MKNSTSYILTILLIITIINCGSSTPTQTTEDIVNTLDENQEDRTIKIVAMGDICFARNPMPAFNEDGISVFENVEVAFEDADITFANLECVLCSDCFSRADKSPDGGVYHLRQDPSIVWMLKSAGVDVVSLANNHTMDYGSDGLQETIKTLDDNQIKHFGAGLNLEEASQPLYIETSGVRFAFIGANEIPPTSFYATDNRPGCVPIRTEKICSLINEAEQNSDFVIISLHWGLEGKSYTTNRQQTLAHRFIDEGADIIFGHHPHVLQKTEWYNDGLICYSMGNFIFNTSIPHWHKSALFVIEVSKNEGIIDYNMIPVELDKNGVPSFTTDEDIVEFVVKFKDKDE